ncbi:hypothetical protein Q2T76_05255, partial [Lactobacillus sp. YT155]|nr:hypothetical protein [Lactobacillus sp. YT155]
MKRRSSILLITVTVLGLIAPSVSTFAIDESASTSNTETNDSKVVSDDQTTSDVDSKEKTVTSEKKTKDVVTPKVTATGQVTVNTPQELTDAVSQATTDTTISLSASFPTTITATNFVTINTAGINITIDGGNKQINMANPNNKGAFIELTNNTNSSFTLKNFNFVNGDTSLLNSTALRVLSNQGTINVDNSSFKDLTMGNGDGGALYIAGNTNITNCSFTNNNITGVGHAGGAIGSRNYNGNLTVSNSSFTGNETIFKGAPGQGGALFIAEPTANSTFNFKNNYFANNQASVDVPDGAGAKMADGGAVTLFNVVSGNQVNFTGNTFSKNVAGDDGGALLIQTNSTITDGISFNNNTFVDNRAYGKSLSTNNGGAIQIYANGARSDSRTSLINYTNNTFVGNVASYYGGAVGSHGYWLNKSAGAYKGNLFVNNTSKMATKNNIADMAGVTGSGDLGNNIGYDNGTANTVDPVTVFGQFAPALVPNYSGIKAGTSKDAQVIPTIPVVPAKDADNKITGVLTSVSDHRSFGRALPSDIGATENKWVKYDSNGGTFELGAD